MRKAFQIGALQTKMIMLSVKRKDIPCPTKSSRNSDELRSTPIMHSDCCIKEVISFRRAARSCDINTRQLLNRTAENCSGNTLAISSLHLMARWRNSISLLSKLAALTSKAGSNKSIPTERHHQPDREIPLCGPHKFGHHVGDRQQQTNRN